MQLMRWIDGKDMLLLGEVKKGFASYSYMSNALRYIAVRIKIDSLVPVC